MEVITNYRKYQRPISMEKGFRKTTSRGSLIESVSYSNEKTVVEFHPPTHELLLKIPLYLYIKEFFMQTTFIYGLECPLTKHIRYVGKSNNPNNRVKNHIYEHKIGKSSNNLKEEWFNILTEKGLRPIMIILDEVPMDEWGYWERWWLELIKSWGFDTVNLVQGGNGCSTHHPTTIEKIRESVSGEHNVRGFMGKKHNKDSINKNIESNKKTYKSIDRTGDKNPFYGRKHSEETKRKMRESKLNKKLLLTNDE